MRINVDDVAFMDRRFKLLGGRLGMTWQEALGRCLPVWALAYARRSAVLPAADVDALAERQGFADAMRDVDLAADDDTGGLYLRGVADRIDFLLIQDAKRAKARQAKLGEHGVSSPRGPSRGTRAVPVDPPGGVSRGNVPGQGPYSLAPDLAPDLEDQDLSLPREAPAPAAAPPPPPPPPPVAEPHPAPRSSWHDRKRWWDAMLAADARIREAGIDPLDPTLPAAPAGENEKNLAVCARQLAEAGFDPAAVDARMLHIVSVAEAEAVRDQRRLYFKPALIWDPKRANRAADTSLAEARRPRLTKPGDRPAAATPARKPDPSPPIVTISPEERAAAQAVLDQARAELFGVTSPSAPPDPGADP